MKCDNMPALLPQAEAREAAPAAAAEPEVKRGGIFGWSYDRRDRAASPKPVPTHLPRAGMVLASANLGCNGYGEAVFCSHPREETDEPIDRPRR
jgi:hypothetical protein